MDFTVEKMDVMKLIGFETICDYEETYRKIPQFWDEIRKKYIQPVFFAKQMEGETQQVIADCGIGEFGLCMDDAKAHKCRYLIAGTYKGGRVPEGMTVVEIPGYEWAKFECVGAMPDALQKVNDRIFREWLPDNPEYEIADGFNIEWYAMGDVQAPDYESAIWIPVKKK